MWFVISLLIVVVVSNSNGKSSKLIEIACARNPELSFCDDSTPLDAPRPNAAGSNESSEVETLLNLPTFEETLLKAAENSSAEIIKRPAKKKTRAPDTITTTEAVITDDDETPIMEGNKTKNITDREENIPDDPILEEPVPKENTSKEVEANKDEEGSHLGSLLRLPKPPRKTSTTTSPSEPELVTPPPLPQSALTKPPPKHSRVGYVNVYISQFCIDRRKEFLVKCRTANVAPSDIKFCKAYPLECQSDEDGVVPLLAYCERFIHSYVKICAPKSKRDRQGRQFCKAYDQFCVPPPTPADLLESNQALTRCEDIQAEARKVCNPFPPPHDRLNYLRCSQFLKFCSKYVDWQ